MPSQFEKKGIGKKLVKAAEEHLLEVAQHQFACAQKDRQASSESSKLISLIVNMEMGVINQRADLFPWYESQGYAVVGNIYPNDAELTRICLEGADIYCVLLRKNIFSN